jgi:DNA mismatch endonuclease (patch repair protein)
VGESYHRDMRASKRPRPLPNPPASSIGVRNVMRANRRRNTGPELLLRSALTRAGLRGYRLEPPGVPGRPEIAFSRYKIAVFVHGCFWHRCPHCEPALPRSHRVFWKRKFELNVERDERKRRDVIEFWECEVKRDSDKCASRVSGLVDRLSARLEAAEEASEAAGARRMQTTRKTRG